MLIDVASPQAISVPLVTAVAGMIDSHARQVAVTLSRIDGQAVLEIADDGRGFDTARTAFGQGLRGMCERLAGHGGTLDVHSDRSGTTVIARCPAAQL